MLIECTICEAVVDAVEQSQYEHVPQDDPPAKYTFLCCPRCKYPMLAEQSDYGQGYDRPHRLYPATQYISWKIPSDVRAAMAEAITCVKGRAFTAGAIMCRKVLEGACGELGYQGVLHEALKKMRTDSVIDERLAEWANELRMFGNEAAHNIKVQVSQEDARDLMEFTNAFLDNLFVLREQFEKFKARRAGA